MALTSTLLIPSHNNLQPKTLFTSMDLKSKNIESFTHTLKSQYLIRLTQMLVSVSLCSFLFSPSSVLAFLHYFNFYFSTFPFQLFSHTIDKNCMFLLCNGLLVFVGITRYFSGSALDDEPSKLIEDGSQSHFSDVEANEPMLEKTSEPDDEQKQSTDAEEAMETKYSADQGVEEDIEMVIGGGEEDGKRGKGKGKGKGSSQKEEVEEPDEKTGLLDAREEEEEEKGSDSETDESVIEENEEEDRRLTTEEMNEIFDEFIRRMKKDLRVEAQRQLVMV